MTSFIPDSCKPKDQYLLDLEKFKTKEDIPDLFDFLENP